MYANFIFRHNNPASILYKSKAGRYQGSCRVNNDPL